MIRRVFCLGLLVLVLLGSIAIAEEQTYYSENLDIEFSVPDGWVAEENELGTGYMLSIKNPTDTNNGLSVMYGKGMGLVFGDLSNLLDDELKPGIADAYSGVDYIPELLKSAEDSEIQWVANRYELVSKEDKATRYGLQMYFDFLGEWGGILTILPMTEEELPGIVDWIEMAMLSIAGEETKTETK